MGKSKLRKPEQPKLDKKYGGVAVSRNALEDDDDNDPFAPVDDDSDEDPFATQDHDSDVSDDASMDGSGVDLDGSDESSHHGVIESKSKTNRPPVPDTDNSDVEDASDDSESDGSDESEVKPTKSSASRDKLKALNAAQSTESALVSSLTASSADQARKGAAVEQQQGAFDRLLDSRIKLHKAVTLSNEVSPTSDDEADVSDATAKAEAAALSLWSTIDSIRCDILTHHSSTQANPAKKRKISPLTPTQTTPLSTLHDHAQTLETTALAHRQSTLNHWYARTRPASAPSASRSALTSTDTTSISTVLETYLNTNLPKLLPTTCPSPHTFSDTPFYQSLLTTLIASRTNAASLPSSLPSSLPTRSQNPKVKKNVDTKASKGRKIRYTVHEKLQNFMAPEDRSTWTDEGRREFFGSLFGQRVAPVGAADGGANGEGLGEDGVEVDKEEGALRLFRRSVAT